MNLILKTGIFCFCLYLCFWFYENLDIVSVLTGTKTTIQYEFSKENLNKTVEAVKNVVYKDIIEKKSN